MKFPVVRIILALLVLSASDILAQDNATIQGYVMDDISSMPYSNVEVMVFSSDDHASPVANAMTNASGYYSVQVPAGRHYRVVISGRDFSDSYTTKLLEEGVVYPINFKGQVETNVEARVVEKYGFWIVVVVALVILSIILADQFFLRRRRIISGLERESRELETRIEKTEIKEGDEVSRLRKERDQIGYMINLTKIKFHKRNIDEESFREIVRDYQKKLIEIEAKLNELGEK
ncbi:MAG: carboxypeptidase-like regulatory domain-containing protein [Candidatus Altiarchaeota archaeon]